MTQSADFNNQLKISNGKQDTPITSRYESPTLRIPGGARYSTCVSDWTADKTEQTKLSQGGPRVIRRASGEQIEYAFARGPR